MPVPATASLVLAPLLSSVSNAAPTLLIAAPAPTLALAVLHSAPNCALLRVAVPLVKAITERSPNQNQNQINNTLPNAHQSYEAKKVSTLRPTIASAMSGGDAGRMTSSRSGDATIDRPRRELRGEQEVRQKKKADNEEVRYTCSIVVEKEIAHASSALCHEQALHAYASNTNQRTPTKQQLKCSV